MGSSSPLIFIHYGQAFYLRKTLACARRSNPEQRIVLLGDRSNRMLASGVAEFVDFQELEDGAAVKQFQRVFRPIQGQRHRFNKLNGTDFWLQFVFKRWFLIDEFLNRSKIRSFWTFDTDTLVLAQLASREERFSDAAATTQCDGNCLNGFIGSSKLVEDYTDCILDLFSDEAYLETQRQRLKTHAGLAFNEMDAFGEFCRRSGVRVRRAAECINGEAFDDALAFPGGYEPGARKVLGRTEVKRLFVSREQGLYARLLPDMALVRLLSCNMSWMPDYVWKKLAPFSLAPDQDAKVKSPVESELREVDLSQPLTDKITTVLKRKVFETKRALGGWRRRELAVSSWQMADGKTKKRKDLQK